MESIIWEDKEELNKIDWIKKYNGACDKWISKKPNEISKYYSYFKIEEHKLFVEEICRKINLDLSGVGLEIGSGPGIFSNSVIKIFEKIEKIFLLEKVPNVYSLQKKIAKYNGTENKLVNVLGDFNNIKLPNESLDFILDFDSIHHSENFELTFSEISRVLKPGGKLFCFDRGQPNYVTKNQINYLLEIEYSRDYKIENGIDPKMYFTRKMNGETEPYLKDWCRNGIKNNLSPSIYLFRKKSIKHFLRSLYGLLVPFIVKKIINKGVNITTHYQSLLSYINIKKIGGIKVLNLDYSPKLNVSPNEKMVFLFSKKI